MTIKTLAAVVGTLAIIVVLFFITKITTPSRLVAKSGFFAAAAPTIGVVEQALLVSGNLSGWRAAKSSLSKQFGLAGRAEAGRESRAEAEAREGASMIQNDFAFRIDRWTDDGERIVEHVAGAEDFQIAMATYHAARKCWPKAAMTLRQGTWVIEDSRRTRIGTLFSFPCSEKGREGGGR